MIATKKNLTIKTVGISAITALLMSTTLLSYAAEPVAQSSKKAAVTQSQVAQPAASATPSCSTVMNKTKEFRGSPEGQIDGICKNNRNSPAYWSCMNKRIDKGQGFADAGMRCNRITAVR